VIDTLQIYQDLAGSLGQPAAQKLASVLGVIYQDLQQTVTKEDFRELKQVVADLAEAQKRTEQRVEELAEAQKRTEQTMLAGFRDLDRRFGVLGARWGDRAEGAFRQGLLEVVQGLGYTVEHYQGQDPEGFIDHTPRSYDLDILVHDGELVVAEIKSNASGADVTEFHRCVLLYERQTGRLATRRILVAVTIQADAEERAKELGLVVATNFAMLPRHEA
jgi:hypothetical protein